MNKTMTLEQFNNWYWRNFPKSSYRRGQAFLNLFVENKLYLDEYGLLWDEKDNQRVSDLIWRIMLINDWDCNNLVVVRPELLNV